MLFLSPLILLSFIQCTVSLTVEFVDQDPVPLSFSFITYDRLSWGYKIDETGKPILDDDAHIVINSGALNRQFHRFQKLDIFKNDTLIIDHVLQSCIGPIAEFVDSGKCLDGQHPYLYLSYPPRVKKWPKLTIFKPLLKVFRKYVRPVLLSLEAILGTQSSLRSMLTVVSNIIEIFYNTKKFAAYDNENSLQLCQGETFFMYQSSKQELDDVFYGILSSDKDHHCTDSTSLRSELRYIKSLLQDNTVPNSGCTLVETLTMNGGNVRLVKPKILATSGQDLWIMQCKKKLPFV